MSEVFRCEDKDTLVAYLYGEVEGDVRREVERHLRTCTACAREVEGLHGVRQDLQLWMPPEPQLGFSIVQNAPPDAGTANVRPASPWASLHALPVWAQVAAAALVLAASAAIANVQVRSTPEGVVVTTGWMERAAPVAAPAPLTPSDQEWRGELVALQENLRRELREELRNEVSARQGAIRAAMTTIPETPGDSTAVIRRVQSMIEASEERQRQEMALRFAQADRIWNVRWNNDRATLNRHLGNLQGRTIAVQAGQQELRNQMLLQRVSTPQPNQ